MSYADVPADYSSSAHVITLRLHLTFICLGLLGLLKRLRPCVVSIVNVWYTRSPLPIHCHIPRKGTSPGFDCKSATIREIFIRDRRGIAVQKYLPDLDRAACSWQVPVFFSLLRSLKVLVTSTSPILIKHAESICLASSLGSDGEHAQAGD